MKVSYKLQAYMADNDAHDTGSTRMKLRLVKTRHRLSRRATNTTARQSTNLWTLHDGIWPVEGQPLGGIDRSRRSYMSGTVLTVTLPLLRFKDRMLVTPNSIK